MWYVACHVQFQVLNNLENAASLNNLLLPEGFKWETRSSYLGKQNSTHFIETRFFNSNFRTVNLFVLICLQLLLGVSDLSILFSNVLVGIKLSNNLWDLSIA